MKFRNRDVLQTLGVTFTLIIAISGCSPNPSSGVETPLYAAYPSSVASQDPTVDCGTSQNASPPETSFALVESVGTIAVSNEGLTLYRLGSTSANIIYPIARGNSDARVKSIRWSPDGEKISFVYQTSVNPLCKASYLMIANLTKGSVKKLTSINDEDGPSSWSQDGHRVAFVNREGELLTIDVETGGVEVIDKVGVPGSSTDWVDDAIIAYVRFLSPGADSEYELVGLNIQESTEEVLVSSPHSKALSNPGSFDITPDGRYLAYLNSGNVYIQDLRTGSSSNTYIDQGPEELTWSLDSQVLVIRIGMAGVSYLTDLPSPTLFTTEITGLLGSQPWLPDGYEIVVSEGTDKAHSLRKCDLFTNDCTVLDFHYQPPYVWAVSPGRK